METSEEVTKLEARSSGNASSSHVRCVHTSRSNELWMIPFTELRNKLIRGVAH